MAAGNWMVAKWFCWSQACQICWRSPEWGNQMFFNTKIFFRGICHSKYFNWLNTSGFFFQMENTAVVFSQHSLWMERFFSMWTSLSRISIQTCCIRHQIFQGNLFFFFLVQRKYRTKAETLPFTPVADRVDYVTAKNSTEILSDVSLLSVLGYVWLQWICI